MVLSVYVIYMGKVSGIIIQNTKKTDNKDAQKVSTTNNEEL